MKIETIDDLEDPRVAVYRHARDGSLRDAAGLFAVESRLCVRRLFELDHYRPHSVFVTRAALDALRDVLERADPSLSVYVASASVLKGVIGYNLHRGCIALVERPVATTLEDLLDGQPRLLVGLEGVADPENVGNVFRNALAFGADAVVLSAGCADPLYRKAIRVSMAATLRTPFAHVEGWPDALERLRATRFVSVAMTTSSMAVELSAFDAPRDGSVVLLLGSEGEGLRDETRGAVDLEVRIAMAPGVDSLNVATASGIALRHCHARRARA